MDRLNETYFFQKSVIGRKSEFVQRQQLSRLKNTVIPLNEIDDPLISDPLRVIDFEWENNRLTLKLSQKVNRDWIWSLNNMGSFTYREDIAPTKFEFHGDQAIISARESNVQECINYLKTWIPITTQVYRRKLEEEKQAEENKRKLILQNQIAEKEAQLRLKENIKI